MRKAISTLLLLLLILHTPKAQVSVEPFSFEIITGEFTSFDKIGTKVKLWVNTMDNNFIDLLPNTHLDLIDVSSKANYSDKIAVKSMGVASDTTGFIIEIFSESTPTQNTKKLRLSGTIAYLATSYESNLSRIEVSNLADYQFNYGSTEIGGKPLELRRVKVSADGVLYTYSVSYDGKPVTTLSTDEVDFGSTVSFEKEKAKVRVSFLAEIANSKEETIEVDKVFGLGL